jgi:RimJ/RimL family protein N-acetyltransferase
MYADEHRSYDVKRKVRAYWGNGYMFNQLSAYLERKNEEDTETKKIRATSRVYHRKQDKDNS